MEYYKVLLTREEIDGIRTSLDETTDLFRHDHGDVNARLMSDLDDRLIVTLGG